MKTYQRIFNSGENLQAFECGFAPSFMLVFSGEKEINGLQKLRDKYPDSIIIGCSTAGEICDVHVVENQTVVTAVHLEQANAMYHSAVVENPEASYSAGFKLGKCFNEDDLKHVFVLSEGLQVNGTKLSEGLKESLPPQVSVSGGLAGDGARFGSTYIIDNEARQLEKAVVAIGFYGNISVGCASVGGWQPFGIERRVTRAKNNVVFEIDHQPALQLYKSFLGSQADGLPASGLLFPLSMRNARDGKPLVRTILGINENEQSLTFAGDIPLGASVKLMKANVNNLIDGAEQAAKASGQSAENTEFSVLVSCIGRKLVLKQLVEEEIEVVRKVQGDNATLAGFYSYGEIAPFGQEDRCELHNQTMTITTYSEKQEPT